MLTSCRLLSSRTAKPAAVTGLKEGCSRELVTGWPGAGGAVLTEGEGSLALRSVMGENALAWPDEVAGLAHKSRRSREDKIRVVGCSLTGVVWCFSFKDNHLKGDKLCKKRGVPTWQASTGIRVCYALLTGGSCGNTVRAYGCG